MSIVLKGIMQVPATTFKDDFSFDAPTFERMVNFHVCTGATMITWPNHKSESLNMTIAERKLGAEVVVRVVAGRAPVVIHVSCLSVEDTFDLALHAQKIGADAILAITPYFWKPSSKALYDHFVRLATSIDLPFIGYNSPAYLGGVEFTGDITRRLIERLPNFIGMKEASFNSEKYLEISRVALALRPNFAMITGVEYVLPSFPLGGAGAYFSASSIAPKLCVQLWDACIANDWAKAREYQYKISQLWVLFRDQHPSSFKGAMAMMGRPIGPTRPPLPTATKERQDYIQSQLEALGILQGEPHGW
jgi:dihydrodipicolinate synthase/N-acetylneuraminate lyase